MQEYRETCCVNTSRSSQTFQNTFNWPNSAPMQVSQRLLKKDHVESTPCLEVINHLMWKDGFVETRWSVQFWMWLSVITKEVTELNSWSNLYLARKLARGQDRERDQQKRNGDVGRDSHRRHWREYASMTIPVSYHERKWMDVEPRRFDKSCLEVSKLIIKLLRHDSSVPREEDGAVKFQDMASIFRSEFTFSSHWSIRTWLSFLQRGGGVKKRFQYCVNPSSPETLLYLRAIQGHSGVYTYWSYIARQRVVAERLRRAHLSRWKLPWPTLHSSSLHWFRAGKTPRKGGMRCA